MTKDDETAAATALINWFRSQDIEPKHAALILSNVIATIIATRVDNLADAEIGLHHLVNHTRAMVHTILSKEQ